MATLNSAVYLSTTLKALNNPKSKRYNHMVPGATVIMPDGTVITFDNGQLITDDPAVIAQLDAIANSPTSMIYTEAGSQVVKQVQAELQARAAEAATS